MSIVVFAACLYPARQARELKIADFRSWCHGHLPGHTARMLRSPVFWLFVAVLLVSLLVRVIDLESFPPPYHGDEGEMAVSSMDIITGAPSAPPFFGTGWLFHPTLQFYTEALFIKAFGLSMSAVRLTTVIWGIFGVVTVYFLGAFFFEKWTGLVASGLSAISPVDIHFSRFALNNIQTMVLGSVSILIFCLAIRHTSTCVDRYGSLPHRVWNTRTPLYFGASGIILGLSQYFYFSSRLFPLILFLIALYAFAKHRHSWRELTTGLILTTMGTVIVILPIAFYFAHFPDKIAGARTFGELFIFRDIAKAEADLKVTNALAVLAVQLRESLLQFITNPDNSSFLPWNSPVLIGPVSGLFILGTILSFVRAGVYPFPIILVWFWTTLIFGNVLFTAAPFYAPYTPRLIGLFPVIHLLCAFTIILLFTTLRGLLSRHYMPVLYGAAGVFLLGISLSSIDLYFQVFFANNPSILISRVARALGSAAPEGSQIYNMVDGFPIQHPQVRFLAYGRTLNDLKELTPDGWNKIRVTPTTVFIVSERLIQAEDIIKSHFANVETREVYGVDGKLGAKILVGNGPFQTQG